MIGNIKNLVFDLDDTLYPKSLGYKDVVEKKIIEFFENKMNISREEYWQKAKSYREMGASVDEIFQDKGYSFAEFLSYVCENDMSKIEPNPELAKRLSKLSHRFIIYTDSNHKHVQDTLRLLEVHGFFKEIFTVIDCGCLWKSNPNSFERFLDFYKINPTETAIFEDSLTNLKKAKELGMLTIFISEDEIEKPEFCDFMFKDINSALDIFINCK